MSMLTTNESYEHYSSVGSKKPIQNEREEFLPPWFDLDRFEKARKLCNSYSACLHNIHGFGLLLTIVDRAAYEVLIRTGKSKDLVALYNRYSATSQHVHQWYVGRVWDENDEAHKSIRTVDRMHRTVSNTFNQGKQTDVDRWNISQRELSQTQFAFIGLAILYPEKLGFSTRKEDLELLMYFWRVIGYLMGVADEFNLFGCDDYETARKRCEIIRDQDLRPNLIKGDPDCALMSKQIHRVLREMIFLPYPPYQSMMSYLFELLELPWSTQLSFRERFWKKILKSSMSRRSRMKRAISGKFVDFTQWRLKQPGVKKRAIKRLAKEIEQEKKMDSP